MRRLAVCSFRAALLGRIAVSELESMRTWSRTHSSNPKPSVRLTLKTKVLLVIALRSFDVVTGFIPLRREMIKR